MMSELRKKWILVAQDEPREKELILRVLTASHAPPDIILVRDGAEVLDCLYRRRGFQVRQAGNPAVILLNLELPRAGGLEVLRQVKCDTQLSAIPIVVLTSSCQPNDIARCYHLGANACVIKPMVLRRYAAALEEIRTFWVAINEPPPERSAAWDEVEAESVDRCSVEAEPASVKALGV